MPGSAGWGCGESLPEIQPLCDGSEGARLVYTGTGGEFAFEDSFTARYGYSYLVIDGQCDYWLGQRSLQGLRVGSIDAERAARLSAEREFGRYSTAPGAIGQPCPDSGVAYLRDVGGTLIDTACVAPERWPLARA